jgi:hypothetical protein
MSEECHPPSEIVSTQEASQLGDQFEGMIREAYCDSKGGCSIFPLLGDTDFVDFREGFGNIPTFIAFLKRHNAGINVDSIARQFLSQKSGLKIPDIMTHQPPKRLEFYEIKPNSTAGVAAGRAKVLSLIAFCGLNKLPYQPGTVFSPDRRILLQTAQIGFSIVTTRFHFFLLQPGLIVYEICTEVTRTQSSVQEDAARRALVAAIALLLAVAAPLFGVPAAAAGS